MNLTRGRAALTAACVALACARTAAAQTQASQKRITIPRVEVAPKLDDYALLRVVRPPDRWCRAARPR